MVIQYKSQFPDQVVQGIVREALRDQAELARLRFEQYQKECLGFENKFKMSSDEFTQKFENGELGDDEVWLDWFAAIRGRDIWEVKTKVLNEVAE